MLADFSTLVTPNDDGTGSISLPFVIDRDQLAALDRIAVLVDGFERRPALVDDGLAVVSEKAQKAGLPCSSKASISTSP